jgi:DNA-binding Lrp family transcriptional regulator
MMADTVAVSTGTVRTRVLKLLDSGVVRIGLIWDPDSQDGLVRIGLGLRVRGSASDTARKLASLPEITFLTTAIGVYDIVATLDGSSSASAITALNAVREIPEITHSETWVHLQVLREKH